MAEKELIVLPGLVVAEILAGLSGPESVAAMERLLSGFAEAPPLEWRDYLAAAALFRECRRAGRTVRGLVDCLIAQICIRHRLMLLTSDHDFRAIARCSDLALAVPV